MTVLEAPGSPDARRLRGFVGDARPGGADAPIEASAAVVGAEVLAGAGAGAMANLPVELAGLGLRFRFVEDGEDLRDGKVRRQLQSDLAANAKDFRGGRGGLMLFQHAW